MQLRGRITLVLCLLVTAVARAGTQQPAPKEGANVEQEKPEQPGSPAAETIVITATRPDADLLEVPRSLYISDDQLLDTPNLRSLADAVGRLPGVFLQKTNRGAGAPFLRGLVGPQNLILVDGIRFNNSTFRTGPNQYLALLDGRLFDRVELLLGPASVRLGSDAMGGAINLIPADFAGQATSGGRAGLSYASADQAAGAWLGAGVRWHGLGAQAAGVFRRFGILRAGGGVEQPLSGYWRAGWHQRLSVALADDMRLTANYLAGRVRGAGRADRLTEGRFRFYDNDDDLFWLDWSWRPGTALRRLRLAASLHHTSERARLYRCELAEPVTVNAVQECTTGAPFDDDALPPPPIYDEKLAEDSVLTPGLLVNGEFSLLAGKLTLLAGADAYFDLVSSRMRRRRAEDDPPWNWTEQSRGNFSDGSRYLNTGGFAQARLQVPLATGLRLLAEGGLRLSHFGASAPEVPGLGDVSYSHTGLVGSASLGCVFSNRGLAWLGFHQGFRAPNLQESTVLGDTGSKFEVPNGSLGPERSHTLELGGSWRSSRLRLRLVAFFNWLSDMISERELAAEEWQALGLDPLAVGDKPVVQRVNSQSGRIWGTEGWFELGPWRGLSLQGRLAWLRGEEIRSDGTTVPARRIPPLFGSVALRYEPAGAGWYLEGFVDFAGPQRRLHPSDEKDLRICENPAAPGNSYADAGLTCPGSPAWATLNLRAGLELGERLAIDLVASNLTDARYRTHGSGVDAPGLDLALQLAGSF